MSTKRGLSLRDGRDRLWVRETWAQDDLNCDDVHCGNRDHIWWRANEEKIVADSFAGNAHWRSSRFMPRWASRITLEIVSVRVERLRDIRLEAIENEGIPHNQWAICLHGMTDRRDFGTSNALWDSINAKRGYGWESNPWVWLIEFKVVPNGV